MRWWVLVWLVAGCASATRASHNDLAGTGTPDDDLATPAPAGDLATLATLADLATSVDLKSADLGPVARSWASPSTAPTDVSLGWNGNYATNYRVTLAADDPAAMIYYTTDGAAPSMASLHALSPAIDVAATTRLRWFAAGAAGPETAHDDTYGVDAANQSKAGFVVYDANLDGQGPVATLAGGGTVTAQASFRLWYQSGGCSGGTFPCAAQLVYGVDKVDQGCLFDGGANNFAGSATQTKSFTVTVPATPGVHEVQVAQIEDLSCAMAMTAMTLKNRPNLVRIGILIVK
jgi:hypothetical protein